MPLLLDFYSRASYGKRLFVWILKLFHRHYFKRLTYRTRIEVAQAQITVQTDTLSSLLAFINIVFDSSVLLVVH